MLASANYPYRAPEADTTKHLDPDGVPTCFLAWANPTIPAVDGQWLTSDILIASLVGSDPNAHNIKLTGFTYTSHVLWSGATLYDSASLLVNLDAARIIDRQLIRDSNPLERTVNLNQALNGTNVQFGLYQSAGVSFYGWIEQHIYGYKVFGTYETSTPPQARQVTVRVYDIQSATPIVGAAVTLISGQSTIASAQSDADGFAVLNGFNQKYGLKVYATDYVPYPFEVTVDLTLGDASIDAKLTYSAPPPFELPWWWWIPVAGVGVVGLWIWLGKPSAAPSPPIYVVK